MFKRFRWFPVLLGILSMGHAQELASFKAGFLTVHLVDSTRSYKPGTDVGHPLRYRPVDLDIWYPSNPNAKDRPMIFGDMFRLHETRALAYQEETDYTGFSDELIVYLAAGLGMEASQGRVLLERTTQSYLDAPVRDGSFPLIIYMAGYNGMGWENYRLLESLAESGFVVVSISSIGGYPGDMTNGLGDTMEQVYDAELAREYLRGNPKFSVDQTRTGIVGLSWGGMAGIILLDRNPDVKAMVSLDGTDTFYYGENPQDDACLDSIYDAGVLRPEESTAAFLSMEAGDRLSEFTPTEEYRYSDRTSGPVRYIRFLNSAHEDFSSLPWALETDTARVSLYEEISMATLYFLSDHLRSGSGFEAYWNKLLQAPDKKMEPPEYAKESVRRMYLSGTISDAESGKGLAYANVSVLGKPEGTVSQSDGSFQLALSEPQSHDSLQVSMLGYEALTLKVNDLASQGKPVELSMHEAFEELDEIVLTARKWKKKTLGNKTESKFIGHLFYADQLGKEMGIRVNVSSKPLVVDTFGFHVSHNRFAAKTLFRLNVYSAGSGKPMQNLLTENIIIPVEPGQTGRVQMDLKAYNIVLTEDVIVTLEWIDSVGEIGPTDAMAISLGVLTGGTYERGSKTEDLKKIFRGMGLGFTMEVRY